MPDEPKDFLRDVLHFYREQTNQLTVRAEDYATAQAWMDAGVPASIAIRGIEDKLARAKRGNALWYPRMKLNWASEDVLQLFDDWKRAVGMMSRER